MLEVDKVCKSCELQNTKRREYRIQNSEWEGREYGIQNSEYRMGTQEYKTPTGI
jgi:hypothetical protein